MKTKPVPNSLVLLWLLVFSATCAAGAKAAEPVFKGDLEKAPKVQEAPVPSRITVSAVHSKEGPFQHPFRVSEARMRNLLQGILFQKSATFRWKNPEQMLTGTEAAQLARRIVPALSTAGKDEWIAFRLAEKGGDTTGRIFVTKGYLNFRILTIQGYNFLKKGTKSISHAWKLVPQEGQGFFPSKATVWNQGEETNWIVVKLSDLSPSAIDDKEAPEKQPLKERIHVFP
jgi:hypothetical protein